MESLKNLDGLFDVKEDFKITTTNGISSVPTFIIGSQKYVNPDYSELSKAIDFNLTAETK
ncbi:hypothetical protein D3C80_1846600 [compost metagenome]